MTTNTLTPNKLFATLGETLGEIAREQKENTFRPVTVSKMTLEMKMVISPDLKQVDLPSNKQLQMDGRKPSSFLQVKVSAY